MNKISLMCLLLLVGCASSKQNDVVVSNKVQDGNKYFKDNPIYFKFDSADTTKISTNAEKINNYKEIIKELDRDTMIEMRGYCDKYGSFEYNKILAQKRIDSVLVQLPREFFENGVLLTVKPIGKLEYREDLSKDPKENNALNRRVEAEIKLDK